MRNLPVAEATKHFLICGATGSGKSIGIQLFLQSIAQRFRVSSRRKKKPPAEPDRKLPPRGGEQLVIFDAKGDVLPMLAAMGLGPGDSGQNAWVLNPFDERAAVWNLGEAAQTPGLVRFLATLLIPEERQSTAPYFTDAARELVYAVACALNAIVASEWSLRDLLCALDSREHIQAVTGRHPPAARLATRILDDSQHSSGVLSTMAAKLGRFEQVAALWHTNVSKRHFSVPKFLQRPGVLVLGNDPVLRDSLWPINTLLLRSLTNEILRGPETRQPRH